MSKFGFNASANRIQQALAVSEFPREVLDLFKGVGMVNRTARELIRMRNEQGMEQIVARAIEIDPAGKSRSQILALICGIENGRHFRSYQRETPLSLNQRYRDGIESGLWSTMRQAGKMMEVSPSRLAEASAIAALPQEVLDLFIVDALTFTMGRSLRNIIQLRGIETIKKRAIAARYLIPRPTGQDLLDRLVGIDSPSLHAKLKRRRAKGGEPGGLFVELHIDDADLDSERDLDTILALMKFQRANSPQRARSRHDSGANEFPTRQFGITNRKKT
ncbi:hypothetical protein PQQ84_28320 [Paraburkholderia strydomiana]|uniref:hypothetical protein n=1 Tax=Paraburkholderia strydomiana TaxID=1245417 RepID=UPI0038BE19AD